MTKMRLSMGSVLMMLTQNAPVLFRLFGSLNQNIYRTTYFFDIATVVSTSH